jgi:hypothetical protein
MEGYLKSKSEMERRRTLETLLYFMLSDLDLTFDF